MVILFLPKYVDSLPITSILISSIPGMLIVKSIYANSYKILKKEKDFMFDSLKYLAIAIVITVLSFFYFKLNWKYSILNLDYKQFFPFQFPTDNQNYWYTNHQFLNLVAMDFEV